jgi:hypothetical protein
MSEYTLRFAEKRIDFSVLPDLTDQDLEKLGVVLGDRRKIRRAIANLEAWKSAPVVATAAYTKLLRAMLIAPLMLIAIAGTAVAGALEDGYSALHEGIMPPPCSFSAPSPTRATLPLGRPSPLLTITALLLTKVTAWRSLVSVSFTKGVWVCHRIMYALTCGSAWLLLRVRKARQNGENAWRHA